MVRDKAASGSEVDWEDGARDGGGAACKAVRGIGAAQLGVLAAPTRTLGRTCICWRRLARGLGTSNIDHRLRQHDFRDQADDPLHPALGCVDRGLDRLDALLVVGSQPAP